MRGNKENSGKKSALSIVGVVLIAVITILSYIAICNAVNNFLKIHQYERVRNIDFDISYAIFLENGSSQVIGYEMELQGGLGEAFSLNISDIAKEIGCSFTIYDQNDNKVSYCFVQANGECNTSPSDEIYVKYDLGGVTKEFKILKGGSASAGNETFTFYDDFSSGFNNSLYGTYDKFSVADGKIYALESAGYSLKLEAFENVAGTYYPYKFTGKPSILVDGDYIYLAGKTDNSPAILYIINKSDGKVQQIKNYAYNCSGNKILENGDYFYIVCYYSPENQLHILKLDKSFTTRIEYSYSVGTGGIGDGFYGVYDADITNDSIYILASAKILGNNTQAIIRVNKTDGSVIWAKYISDWILPVTFTKIKYDNLNKRIILVSNDEVYDPFIGYGFFVVTLNETGDIQHVYQVPQALYISGPGPTICSSYLQSDGRLYFFEGASYDFHFYFLIVDLNSGNYKTYSITPSEGVEYILHGVTVSDDVAYMLLHEQETFDRYVIIAFNISSENISYCDVLNLRHGEEAEVFSDSKNVYIIIKTDVPPGVPETKFIVFNKSNPIKFTYKSISASVGLSSSGSIRTESNLPVLSDFPVSFSSNSGSLKEYEFSGSFIVYPFELTIASLSISSDMKAYPLTDWKIISYSPVKLALVKNSSEYLTISNLYSASILNRNPITTEGNGTLIIEIKNFGDTIDVGKITIFVYNGDKISDILDGSDFCKTIQANVCYNETLGRGTHIIEIYNVSLGGDRLKLSYFGVCKDIKIERATK